MEIIGYEFIHQISKNHQLLMTYRHINCGKEFTSRRFIINRRINDNETICSHCNPLHRNAASKLPNNFIKISSNGRKTTLKHVCGYEFAINNFAINDNLICFGCHNIPNGYINIPNKLGKVWRTIKSLKCGHQFDIIWPTYTNRIDSGVELCVICNPTKINKSIKSILPTEYSISDNENRDLKNLYHNICKQATTIHRRTLSYRIKEQHELCCLCNPIKKPYSVAEKELVSVVKSLCSYDIIENDRNQIKPYELDIYIPHLKLAIEYQGEYFHGKDGKSIHGRCRYDIEHRNELKRNMCISNNIKLLEIWEREWKNNRQTILNKLSILLSQAR